MKNQNNFGIIATGMVAFTILIQTNATAFGQDRDYYTLWNPTPRDQMREMKTDRPDKTESPYTLDPGHFQVETDIASFTRDDEGSVRTEAWSIFNANYKIGLCPNSDFQLIVPTYNSVRVRDSANGSLQKSSGFGDMIARLKMNFWGNDGGQTAFAAMPFLKAPTSQDDLGNNAFEGGIIFPLAVALPREWSMGLMTEFDVAKDEDNHGYHPEFINSIALGHSIIGDLGGYVEFFSLVSTDRDSDWIGTVDFGLTYLVNANLQVDCGVNVGVTTAADDFNPFVGVSWRY